MGMTGHIVFDAWDADRPATMSSTVISDIIRGEIGFDGFLMSDDLDMKALRAASRTARAGCVAAGCDVALNCWGRMDEMVDDCRRFARDNRARARTAGRGDGDDRAGRDRLRRSDRQAGRLAGAGGLSDDAELTVDLGAWEGPLDLLLALARAQKVDLRQLSILALVDQYLDYLKRAGSAHLEQAADYLVMAAWLAYLKSGLLLPREAREDPDPEELAMRLQQRLRRLEAMREAGARLMARDRLERDVFVRAEPGRAGDRPQSAVAGVALRTRCRLWRGQGAHRAGAASGRTAIAGHARSRHRRHRGAGRPAARLDRDRRIPARHDR